MQIHVQRGEEELGIFSTEETTKYLAEGRLLETDLTWHEGLNDWAPLGGLIRQFGETKPTLGSDKLAPKAEEEEPAVFGQGRYLKERVLGKGGQGEVWLAHDLQLDRQVAIKQVNPQFAPGTMAYQSLKDEVQKSLELTHPNITRIYDLVDVPGESPFISMEYLEGEDLHVKKEKQEGGHFSWAEIKPYTLSLCDALEYAHGQGMVHRDLKPANLMITDSGELKLTDMGIAEPAKDPDASSATETFISGTPLYWSPQQSQGIKPQATDDIYSLGATLYHLLTGRPPFLGENEEEITKQHLTKTPDDLQQVLKAEGHATQVPAHINQLVLKCLAKDPASRLQGTGYIRDWIKAKGDPVVKKQKRMVVVSGVLGVVALAMGGLAIWAWNQRIEAEEHRGIAETKQQQTETAYKEAEKQKGIAETKQRQAEKAKKEEAKQRDITQIKEKEAETAKEAEAKQRKEAEAAKEAETKQREIAEKRLRNLEEIRVALAKGTALLRETKKPETEGAVQKLLGEISLALKLPNEALEHNEKALALALENLPKDHLLVLTSYNNIGLVYLEKEEYDKALEYFQKPLSILSNIRPRPKYSPRVWEIYKRGAGRYTGKLTSAEVQLDLCETTSYAGIGEVHRGKGEYKNALEYHQKALVIYLELAGPFDLGVATCCNNIGLVYKAKDEHDKALEYYQKAQQFRHRIYSVALKKMGSTSLDFPLLRVTYNNIGLMHSAKGEYDQAIANFQKAATMSSEVLGPNHPHVALIYLNTAFALKANMVYPEAKEYYTKALLIFLKKLGPTDQSIKNIRAELDKLTQEMKATHKQ